MNKFEDVNISRNFVDRSTGHGGRRLLLLLERRHALHPAPAPAHAQGQDLAQVAL